jgi:hypothetical protein
MKIFIFAFIITSSIAFGQTSSMNRIANKAWVLDTQTTGCPDALGIETGDIQFDANSGKQKSMHYSIRSFYKSRADQLLQETWSNFQVGLDGQKSIKQCFYDSEQPKTCVKMKSEELEHELTLRTESKTKIYEMGKKVKIKSERTYKFDLKNNRLQLFIDTKAGANTDFVTCDYRLRLDSIHEGEVVDSDRSMVKESQEAAALKDSESSSVINR